MISPAGWCVFQHSNGPKTGREASRVFAHGNVRRKSPLYETEGIYSRQEPSGGVGVRGERDQHTGPRLPYVPRP